MKLNKSVMENDCLLDENKYNYDDLVMENKYIGDDYIDKYDILNSNLEGILKTPQYPVYIKPGQVIPPEWCLCGGFIGAYEGLK